MNDKIGIENAAEVLNGAFDIIYIPDQCEVGLHRFGEKQFRNRRNIINGENQQIKCIVQVFAAPQNAVLQKKEKAHENSNAFKKESEV